MMAAKDVYEQNLIVPVDGNKEHYVVMKNELILGKGKNKGRNVSGLSLNANKLLRIIISQCVVQDDEFKTYEISISALAGYLSLDPSNLYRSIQKICLELLSEVVLVGEEDPSKPWHACQWISRCTYDGNGKVTIRLHDDMKPYLLGLKQRYTQYGLSQLLDLHSVYGLRVFELLKLKLRNNQLLDGHTVTVYISDDELRRATGTTNRYTKTNDFKKRVVDAAVRDINSIPNHWIITYDYVKSGRKVTGYNFHIKRWNADAILGLPEETKEKIAAAKERIRQRQLEEIYM